jgi:hypothetical protein
LIYLQLRTRLGKEKRPPVTIPATFVLSGSAGRKLKAFMNFSVFGELFIFLRDSRITEF